MTEVEFLAACGQGKEYLQERKNAPHFKLKHRSGRIIDIQAEPEGIYRSDEMTFHDEAGNIYKKELWGCEVNICEPSGEPSHKIGEFDIQDLWEKFGKVPLNTETECIETDWLHFSKGTHREEIWHWIEREFRVSIAALMNGGKNDGEEQNETKGI